jgi:hypothetical protein
MTFANREFAASNEEGTCLWCGKKLSYTYDSERVPNGTHLRKGNYYSIAEDKYIDVETEEKSFKHVNKVKRWELPGPMGNGYFCSISCGAEFGLVFAKDGERLKSKKEEL